MQENPFEIKDVLLLNERVLSVVGVWPLKETYVKFTIAIIYCSVHLMMVYADLFDVLGNLELLVDNLMESLVITLDYITMFILRYNKTLARTIATVKNEIANGEFENIGEMRMYYYYNNITNVFTKYLTYGAGISGFLVYVGPMTQFIQLYKDHGNTSTPLTLPFRVKEFLDFTDYRIFILFYLYEIPLPYVGLYHTSITCLVVILVLHICGRLSALSHRIRNMPWKSEERVESTIAGIVERHLEIIRIGKDIHDAFSVILLLDVGECMLRLALLMYSLLVSTSTSNVTNICTFLPYALVMFIILYSYCYTGEQLMHECSNLQDAYYYCNWPDMPSKNKKSLIICMIHAQRTLQLTAGGFYTFSLYGFTSIIKTCMAYVSMLRTMT